MIRCAESHIPVNLETIYWRIAGCEVLKLQGVEFRLVAQTEIFNVKPAAVPVESVGFDAKFTRPIPVRLHDLIYVFVAQPQFRVVALLAKSIFIISPLSFEVHSSALFTTLKHNPPALFGCLVTRYIQPLKAGEVRVDSVRSILRLRHSEAF